MLKETDTQEMLRASVCAEVLEAQNDRDRKQICGCLELGRSYRRTVINYEAKLRLMKSFKVGF